MKREGFLTGTVLLVATAHFTHDVYSGFFAPLLPLLIAKLGISYSVAGLLTVAQQLPLLLSPLIGAWGDRLGVRSLFFLSPAVTAVTMSVLGLAPSFVTLAALLAVMGVSAAVFHVPAPVIIARVSGGHVGRGMSFFAIGGELARSAAPLVVLGAVAAWGLHGTWRLIPFGVALSIVLHLRFRRMPMAEDFRRERQAGGARAALRRHAPFFAALGGMFFLQGVMKAAFTTFLPTYLTATGASVWFGGVALSMIQFAGVGGALFSGPLSDRFGRRRVLLFAVALAPVFGVLALLLRGSAGLAVYVPLGVVLFAPPPVLLALSQEVDAENRVFINGMYMGMGFTLAAAAGGLFGVLADLTSLEWAFRISVGIAMLAVPVTHLLTRVTPD